jgi:hypothetical protein
LGSPGLYQRCSAIEEEGGCKQKHKHSETFQPSDISVQGKKKVVNSATAKQH